MPVIHTSLDPRFSDFVSEDFVSEDFVSVMG
jgi:hypothetical protein